MSSSDQKSFKNKFSFEHRIRESTNILNEHPDRIPLIIENDKKGTIEHLDKSKYLVPNDITVGHLIHVLRKRISIRPEDAVYLFINGVVPPISSHIGVIYDKNKDEDGFLYCILCGEATFG